MWLFFFIKLNLVNNDKKCTYVCQYITLGLEFLVQIPHLAS